jgi:hypothetical protein
MALWSRMLTLNSSSEQLSKRIILASLLLLEEHTLVNLKFAEDLFLDAYSFDKYIGS